MLFMDLYFTYLLELYACNVFTVTVIGFFTRPGFQFKWEQHRYCPATGQMDPESRHTVLHSSFTLQ